MAKKKTKKIAGDALSAANNIWLAGLGALATTQEEGGKLFKHLVKKGEKVDLKSKVGVDETVEKVSSRVASAKESVEGQVDKAKDAVSGAWGDLAQSFDDQLGAALHRLGVPTRDEIKTLTARVESLIEKVGQAEAKAPARRTRKAAASTAKRATGTAAKTATKKTAAKPRAKAPAASKAKAAAAES